MITKNKNWSEILIQQQQSGLTIAEFCKKFNISTSLISSKELRWILEGIDLYKIKRHKKVSFES